MHSSELNDNLGKFIPVKGEMKHLTKDFEQTVEAVNKIFLCLKIGIISIIERAVDKPFDQSRLEMTESESKESKASPPNLTKFNPFINNIRNAMIASLSLYDDTKKFKITDSKILNSGDYLGRKRFYLSVIVGFSKSLSAKLLDVFLYSKKLRNFCENLKQDQANAEKIKKINSLIDNTANESNLNNLKDFIAKCKNNLIGDENNLDSKLFDSISSYDTKRKEFNNIIARQMELISDMEAIFAK